MSLVSLKWCSAPRDGESATTRYSTLFEFNNARNSRKSLLSGIRVATFP